jgi:transposase
MVDHKIDMSMFEKNIKNDLTGRPAYNPRVLLKLILFAYSNGINSSRRIQNFALYNVLAMALAESQTPDFTVIADFITGMAEEIKTVFTNILLVAEQMNLLSSTVFALDGCKLPSNAGKEQSGTFSDLKDKQTKLQKKIQHIIEIHQVQDIGTTNPLPEEKQRAIKKLESHIKKIDDFLAANEPRIGKRNKESQSNITDNETSKMKPGHGVIQGYNEQAMVDEKHQFVISAKTFGKGQDHSLLEPMLEETAKNLVAIGKPATWLKGKTIIADTGYFSEENLIVADEQNIDAYIPDQNFRKRDPRFETKRPHVPESKNKVFRDDFIYDKDKDLVICPAGQKLPPSRGAIGKLKHYYYKTYHTTKAVCDACAIRGKCLKSEKSRWRNYQLLISDDKPDLVRSMIDKIDTPYARQIYVKRMGIVEPVFANIRTHKRIDRFTLRGQSKVNIQWMLYCIVHNLSKITNFGPPLVGI